MRFGLPQPSLSRLIRGLGLLLLVGLLAACARGGLYGPIPGDARPHSGVDRARTMPIQGIDISRYQGDVNFARVRAAGNHFVYMKATEGKDHVDPMFRANWQRARAAGIPRGAYHFMYWCSTAADQAAWFTHIVPPDRDALPPVLDLEWNNHSSCVNRHDKPEIIEKIQVMLAAMEAHTGKMPIIYTDMNFYDDILANQNFPHALWVRSTAAEPQTHYTGHNWTFWQYTQTGLVNGVKGQVDRNVFYGDQNAWVNFLLTGCDPRMVHALGPTGRCRIEK